MQDRLMTETQDLVLSAERARIDRARAERTERLGAQVALHAMDEPADRLARTKTPIGTSPHEPARKRRRARKA